MAEAPAGSRSGGRLEEVHVSAASDDRRRSRRASRRAMRFGVVTILLGLVVMPLSVLGFHTYEVLTETDEELSAVREIVPAAERRMLAIRLAAALSDERTWSIALLGVERFGVDAGVVEQLLGVDILAEYERAVAVTDDLTDGLNDGTASLAVRIEGLRADRESTNQLAAGYRAIVSEVVGMGRDAHTRLDHLAVGRPSSDALLRRLALTEATAAAQLAVDSQFVSFIASQFDETTGAPQANFQELVENRRIYEAAVAEIELLFTPGPVEDGFRTIRTSDWQRGFLVTVDDQIGAALRFGLPAYDADRQSLGDGTADDSRLFDQALHNLDRLGPFLDQARASSAAWVELSRLAGNELVATAIDLDHAARDDINSSRLLLLATGGVTVLATLVAALLISRSVRHLARGAQRLRDGDTRPFRPSGPRELYVAGVALSEAATNFDLLQRQAEALARGDLDGEVLERAAPGQLGVSLKRVVDQLSHSIEERELAQADVAWEASHDGMTGLQNRSAAISRLRSALEDPRRSAVAVMIVDLDGFKTINDSHGHPAGDEVLVEIARRLLLNCRPEDKVCRMGGDEFVVILSGPAVHDVALDVAHRIRLAVARAFVLASGTRVGVHASIGIAVSEPDSTVEGLLKQADLAVYEAKRTGRDRLVLCTHDLIDAHHRHDQIALDIVDAVDADELRVEYQPVMDATGQVIAFEALARWTHPELGELSPAEFIGIAERTGSIIDVDRWVIRAVVDQLTAWTDADDGLETIPVAVNISTRHLATESVVDDVLGPLLEAGLSPCRLTIEVTETALIEEMADVRQALTTLRAAGIRIAIDDFGTGYSVISQLQAFPVDVVKIDRSFVSGVAHLGSSDAALVKLIVDIAHLLGAQIVAEGVETLEQAQIIVGMGADALQGWLYSRSVPPALVPGLMSGGALPRPAAAAIRTDSSR